MPPNEIVRQPAMVIARRKLIQVNISSVFSNSNSPLVAIRDTTAGSMSNDKTNALTKNRSDVTSEKTKYADLSAAIEKLFVSGFFLSHNQLAILSNFCSSLNPACFAHK
jgi:hypothetical protein